MPSLACWTLVLSLRLSKRREPSLNWTGFGGYKWPLFPSAKTAYMGTLSVDFWTSPAELYGRLRVFLRYFLGRFINARKQSLPRDVE